jgi:predicted nucleotidyltransferase component of viral defense system
MSKFFWNTITENMKLVLNGVSQSEIGKHFYLAGGTALALQLGHRLSVDLDFFSPTEYIPMIRSRLDEALPVFNRKFNTTEYRTDVAATLAKRCLENF